MNRLVLYGTTACHLCDQAKALLVEADIPHLWIDVAGDETLMERYGVRIPVLYSHASGRELGWPFDQASLSDFTGNQH